MVRQLVRFELHYESFESPSVLTLTSVASGLQKVVHTSLKVFLSLFLRDCAQIYWLLLERMTICAEFTHLRAQTLVLIPQVFV